MSKKHLIALLAAIPLSLILTYVLFGNTSQTFTTPESTQTLTQKTVNSKEEVVVSSPVKKLVIKKVEKKEVTTTTKEEKRPVSQPETKKEEEKKDALQNSFQNLPPISPEKLTPEKQDVFNTYPTENGQHYLTFVDPRLIQKFDPSTLSQYKYVPSELLVGVKADYDEEAIQTTLGDVEIRPFAKLPGTYHVILSKNVSLEDAITQLNQNEAIDYAEPNFLKDSTVVPSDTYYSLQYAHTLSKSNTAWDISTGSSSIIVAVIDTGVQTSHPDLSANIYVNAAEASGAPGVDDDGNGYVDDINGWDFYYGDPIADDAVGHGTHCAGIIGAKGSNGMGVAGVCWDVKILPCRIGATGGLSVSAAISAIVYASDLGARVLSNSWGGPGYSSSLVSAISYANSKGALFVAAAGNDSKNNDTSPSYPANYSVANVISVASCTSADKLSSFSNYGAGKVHLAAPGSDIASTYPTSSYTYLSGTSMACPFVSGALGLLLSVSPSLSVSEAKSILLSTTDKKSAYSGKTITGGRINVTAMLTAAGGSTGGGSTGGGSTGGGSTGGGSTGGGSTGGGTTTAMLLLGTGDGGTNSITTADLAGGSTTISAFGSDNTGGQVFVAGGDVLPSSSGLEIVAGHGAGGSSKVSVLSPSGSVLSTFTAFSSSENPSGKVHLAVADIASAPGKEILCGTGAGGASKVKVYTGSGSLLFEFTVTGNAGGELYVAAGDVVGSSAGPEIVVGSGAGGPSAIAFFSSTGAFLFTTGSFSTSGVPLPVAVGDVTSAAGSELVFTFGNTVYVYSFATGSYVSVFGAFGSTTNPSGLVHLAVGDITSAIPGDEIYVGSGPSGVSEARIFNGAGALASSGTLSGNPGGEVLVGVMK